MRFLLSSVMLLSFCSTQVFAQAKTDQQPGVL
jgi:hypothetical protein